MCFLQLNDNKFRVKLGVKLAISNLIQSLKIKQEQQQRSSSSVKPLVTDTLSQDDIVSLESTPISPVAVDTSSTQPKVKEIVF